MSVDPLTLYKLMTLYMLNKVNFPLTNAQLSGFFQEKGYTTYIGFQQVLTECGIPATIRRELGDDIDAACGQLRLAEKG